MIMIFKEETFKELEQYETDLHHSKYEGYFRPQEKQMLKRFAQIFYETYGKSSSIVGGCNRCAFKDIQRIANDYFSQKEQMAKEAKNKGVLNNSNANVKNTAIETIEDEKPIEAPKKTTKASTTKKTAKNKKK